jgi:WD40 repeat protein
MRSFDLPNARPRPYALAFSPDGWLLAAWAFGQVLLIDTVAGTVRTLQPEIDDLGGAGTPGIGFTPDGRGVIAFHTLDVGGQAVRIYDVASGEVRRTLKGKGLDAVEPTADGRLVYLAILVPGKQIQIVPWNPLTGKKGPGFGQHAGSLRQLAVSADGQWVAGTSANEVRVWDLRGGKRPTRAVRKVQALNTARSKSGSVTRWPWLSVNALALSANGAFVAAGGSGGIVVWEVQSGTEHVLADWFGDRRRALSFHPNRPLLAYPKEGEEVVFWDAESRSEVQRFAWDIGFLSALAFSPDGMRCAASSEGKVVVWDVDL